MAADEVKPACSPASRILLVTADGSIQHAARGLVARASGHRRARIPTLPRRRLQSTTSIP
jgi:hypothetical protein